MKTFEVAAVALLCQLGSAISFRTTAVREAMAEAAAARAANANANAN